MRVTSLHNLYEAILMNPKSQFVTVTPAVASGWLEKSTGNRPIDARRVARYAEDITSNRWVLSGVPVVFDTNGRLINGHHRLMAVVRAGAAVDMLVVEGVPEGAITYQDDRDSARSGKDVASFEGIPNGSDVITLTKPVWLATQGRLAEYARSFPDFRTREQLELYRSNPAEFQRAVLAGRSSHARFRMVPISLFSFCHYWLPQYGPSVAERFCHQLATGDDLTEGDAVLALRERLANDAANRKLRMVPIQKLALIIKAWRLHFHRRKVRFLKWTSEGRGSEPFPNPDPHA